MLISSFASSISDRDKKEKVKISIMGVLSGIFASRKSEALFNKGVGEKVILYAGICLGIS